MQVFSLSVNDAYDFATPLPPHVLRCNCHLFRVQSGMIEMMFKTIELQGGLYCSYVE